MKARLSGGLVAFAVALALSGCSGGDATPGPSASGGAPSVSSSPAAPITRTQLQKTDFPDTYSTYVMKVVIVPDGIAAWHTHPGLESTYVLEGDIVVTIVGQAPMTLKAGDSFSVPPNTPHMAKAGPKGVTLIGTYVIDKTKPLSTPAPSPSPSR